MNSSVKKVVAGKPIEKLLKNSGLLAVDPAYINDSLTRLQDLRQRYMQSPLTGLEVGRSVLRLPSLNK